VALTLTLVSAPMKATGQATALAPQAPAPQAPPQVFRAGIEVVSLNVTVTDPQGRYITDLAQDDFSVFEDGAKQELTYFNRTNLPIALSLLIDSSASMEQRMQNAQDAAIGFAKKLRPQDLAAGRRLRQPRRDQARVHQQHRPAGSGDSCDRRPADRPRCTTRSTSRSRSSPRSRRRTPMKSAARRSFVLSDGEDTSSLVTFEEVLELAKRSETAIYTIGLQPRETGALKGFREAEFVLRQLAQETGGRAFFAKADRRAEGRLRPDRGRAFEPVLDGLRIEESQSATARSAASSCKLAKPNTMARTKRGYYGPVSH
jgi:Ca-activated chloride channel family protein